MGRGFTVAVAGLVLALAAGDVAAQGAARRVIRDCAECPEMVVLRGGTYMMGAMNEEMGPLHDITDAQPQHDVKVKAFAIGRLEVTQAQWAAVMGGPAGANPGPNLPVEQVSWDEVQQFIQKLNARTGKRYRLPTEAEWEYAARAGGFTDYAFGDDAAGLPAHGWYQANANGRTQPAGTRRANPFGLHDMHGNVWEWVQDCYGIDYVGAPTDGTAVERGGPCLRVARGGGWNSRAEDLRSANRSAIAQDERNPAVGFRLARTLP
ncbi:formylglycine-generating enzyme required for sulfatase activity [Stella humosa]|uniref:Formylglycine-generating enzyme required for sulfatase activity n=1 Tax=Stella humosa TaxID=94 RepID=A0A3N1MDJ7_9PROT|nr:formylglycine-generating enzyme family protein [Stella humosa]ROQ01185.1 formylglycine-generating enzyme required for sulfatase activity [Stella humosa]BBK31560.1 hypothetical protein STHU_21940 [Stella humosa]